MIDPDLILRNPLAIGILVVAFIVGLSSLVFYVRQCLQKKWQPLWAGNLVPALNISPLAVIVLFALIFVIGHFAPVILPIISILFPIFIFSQENIVPNDVWRLNWNKTGSYITFGLKTLCVVIVPLYVAAFIGYQSACMFNLDSDPQSNVLFFFYLKSPSQILNFLLLAVVFAPITEEIIFRGFIYPIFKHRMPRPLAILFTSILFGLIHFHAPTFLPLIFFGIILTLVYEKTGSLGYNIALHSAFNASTCLLLWIIRP